MGTGRNSRWKVPFKQGVKDYVLGNHPLWEFFRTMYQMAHKPFLIGGFLLGAGYCWALLRGYDTPLSRQMRDFIRQEQLGRLRALFVNVARLKPAAYNPSLHER
jgi:hypothetical protein